MFQKHSGERHDAVTSSHYQFSKALKVSQKQVASVHLTGFSANCCKLT